MFRGSSIDNSTRRSGPEAFRTVTSGTIQRSKTRRVLAFAIALSLSFNVQTHAEASDELDVSALAAQSKLGAVSEDFDSKVLPLLSKYCMDCHSGDDPAAKLDVAEFGKATSVATRWHTWQAMLSRTQEHEMPPADYGDQPTSEEIELLTNWTNQFRDGEANKHAGDPGPNSTRRLNNAEYNYTIRDITGVDIRPTASFPIDAANAAGFDNSAESLTLSPALITKYLDAAKQVAEHMVLTQEGIEFAPFSVVTDTDRDKYSVQRIVEFYRSQPIKLSNYLRASIDVTNMLANSGTSRESALTEVATRFSLSPKYLGTVHEFLTQSELTYGPGKVLQQEWKQLLTETGDSPSVIDACEALEKKITEQRQSLKSTISVISGPNGMGVGSQPVILQKNRIVAENRRSCAPGALDPTSDKCKLSEEERHVSLEGTAEDREKIRADYNAFCSVFPDNFMIVERGRSYLSEEEAAKESRGRLLNAGFHSMTGFFRDDQPLYDLVLSDSDKKHLDELWEHFFFISKVHHRHFAGFLWYERAESTFINEPMFDFIRAEDKDATSPEKIARFKEAYISKVSRGNGAPPAVIKAIEDYFEAAKVNLKVFEEQSEASRPLHIDALIQFASKAFRRPITAEENAEIRAFYNRSLELPLADHRTAVEDTLMSILMSPEFLYRWDLQSPVVESPNPESTDGVVEAVAEEQALAPSPRVELEDYELASRLSYFLWCSAPDDELLDLAAKGKLSQPETLREESKRLLASPQSSDMLLEFMGNWLEFRRFESHNAVDREQFPAFNDEVRRSMGQEPIELLRHIIETNGKITDLILADYVLVDKNLASFYGISQFDSASKDVWQRIDNASEFGRGGLLPMGLFLTQNSPGLRTSPVKRGYWVIRKLLGEHIPPPPPDVPELPSSEAQMGELTVREALAKHREHISCAACHKRFDFAGVLLEAFDPVGQPRAIDLGGRAISSKVELPNGAEVEGVEGLKRYIVEERLDDFRRHFCESLVAFALNRSLIIPDTLLVDSMMRTLEENDDSFAAVVECLITSPQFLSKRIVTSN